MQSGIMLSEMALSEMALSEMTLSEMVLSEMTLSEMVLTDSEKNPFFVSITAHKSRKSTIESHKI